MTEEHQDTTKQSSLLLTHECEKPDIELLKRIFELDQVTQHGLNELVTEELNWTHRFQRCIAVDLGTRVNDGRWQPILGMVKNLYAEQVLFLWLENAEARKVMMEQRLRALGFFNEPRIALADQTLCCASYRLSNYNRKRSWNNAKFWANPENFHKYRW